MMKGQSNLPVDGARLWADLMALAEITEPGQPYTRRSFSSLFLEGRTWLTRRFEEAGLAVRLDAGGNLIGRLEGSDPSARTILIGSHSDTVPSGGRFDGIAGVLTALEVLRSLRDSGTALRHAVEVVGVKTDLDVLSESIRDTRPHVCFNLVEKHFLRLKGLFDYKKPVTTPASLPGTAHARRTAGWARARRA